MARFSPTVPAQVPSWLSSSSIRDFHGEGAGRLHLVTI